MQLILNRQSNYILGVGDQLFVSIWGYADCVIICRCIFWIVQQTKHWVSIFKRVNLRAQTKRLTSAPIANAYMIDKIRTLMSLSIRVSLLM